MAQQPAGSVAPTSSAAADYRDLTMATQSIEDYIKAIFLLVDPGRVVQTSALAERLAVRPASVSNMLRRLEQKGLVEYEPYRGAALTAAGETLARRMVRRHRLIERFLTELLGYALEDVHEEAERLEHVVSPRFIEAIDHLLERPATDPHGDPIPSQDGAMAVSNHPSLLDLSDGTSAVVRRVSDADAKLLRYYRQIGLQPRAAIQLVEVAPVGEPITVRVADKIHHLGRRAAAGVFVEVVPNTPR